MRAAALRIGTAIAVALWTPLLRAQDSAAGRDESAAPKSLRIAVAGASVSAGFIDPAPRADGERNSTVKLARALAPMWEGVAIEFRDQSDLLVFLDPSGSAKRQLARIADAPPSLVLGVDLPFWFGYGAVGGTKARLARQDELFALLETLFAKCDAPILLGDYPDMRGADPRMLPVSAVPSVEELATLNRRLREWAARHPQVILFALADFVAAARGQGVAMRLAGEDVTLGTELLLQGDRLHATRTGMAVLALRIAETLHAGLLESHPLRLAVPSFDALATHVGATGEIEDWLDAQAVPAGEGKKR
ncbi:MAG: hypothetical protein HZB39_02105 [Planctomycetes bacterium]|nr:hypothetical protein [Planctomycetota bacterium]